MLVLFLLLLLPALLLQVTTMSAENSTVIIFSGIKTHGPEEFRVNK